MSRRRSGWFAVGMLSVVGCGDGSRPDVFQGSTDIQFTRIDGGFILPDGRIVLDDTPPGPPTDIVVGEGGTMPGSDVPAVDGGPAIDAGPAVDVPGSTVDVPATGTDVVSGIDASDGGGRPTDTGGGPDIADVEMEDVERCMPGTMRQCPLAPGQIERTYTTGRCRRGTQMCGAMGRWDPCVGQIEPINEVCNNVDDNCNGLIDDIIRRCGNGACQIERLVCVLGREIQCEPNRAAATPEACNGFDDDCDGMIDEGDGDAGMLIESCFTYPPEYNGRGACRSGVRACARGQWESCSDIIPQPEVCNGIDDDCDGMVDNNCRDN